MSTWLDSRTDEEIDLANACADAEEMAEIEAEEPLTPYEIRQRALIIADDNLTAMDDPFPEQSECLGGPLYWLE